MEQLTANEVRHTATEIEGKQMLVSSMLRAFADLLEAQERAQPVAWLASCSGPICASAPFLTRAEAEECVQAWDYCHVDPLYTHPASSDAERLTEALRQIAREPRKPWPDPFGHSHEAFARAVHATWCDMNRIARAALAAHSAQAQPPADQFDPERNVRPGDVGTELQTAEQDAADFGTGFEVDGRRVAPERVRIVRGEHAAQPPAASVPDEYQEIARLIGSIFCAGEFKAETWNERELERLLKKTGNWFDNVDQVPKPFLAVQENPNG